MRQLPTILIASLFSATGQGVMMFSPLRGFTATVKHTDGTPPGTGEPRGSLSACFTVGLPVAPGNPFIADRKAKTGAVSGN